MKCHFHLTGITINRVFYLLDGEYLLKQKVVVVQTPEWKFKANIAKNTTFLHNLHQKWQKTEYFQEFHFSQY